MAEADLKIDAGGREIPSLAAAPQQKKGLSHLRRSARSSVKFFWLHSSSIRAKIKSFQPLIALIYADKRDINPVPRQ